jgi:hypothetical protein
LPASRPWETIDILVTISDEVPKGWQFKVTELGTVDNKVVPGSETLISGPALCGTLIDAGTSYPYGEPAAAVLVGASGVTTQVPRATLAELRAEREGSVPERLVKAGS